MKKYDSVLWGEIMRKRNKGRKLRRSQVVKKANRIRHNTAKYFLSKNKIRQKNIKQILLSFALLLLLGVVFSQGVPFFENMVPENENWAVATIALPIALLGIYISILVPTFEKYNTLFAGMELRKIYAYTSHPFDFSYLFLVQIFYKFLVWIGAYFSQNYTTMIACSLWLCFELVYLILFTIWKYQLQPHKLYIKYILYTFWGEFCKSKKSITCTNSILPLLKGSEVEKSQNIVEKEYYIFFRTIDELMACIISNRDCKKERLAFLALCEKAESLELNETCLIVTLSLLQKTTHLYSYAVSEKEYDFALALADQAIMLTDSCIQKCCDYIIKDSKEMALIFDNVSDDFSIKDIKVIKEIPSLVAERRYNFLLVLLLFIELTVRISEISEAHEGMNCLKVRSKTWSELKTEYRKAFESLSLVKESLLEEIKEKNKE